MPRTLQASDVAAKWANNLMGAKATIEAGVKGVTENPMQKAADNAEKYVQGVMRAKESGKYQRGLNRVTLQDWKSAMLNKGVNRLQNGVQEAKGKMTAFLTQFLPFVANVSAQVQAMPNMTENDRENRMIQNVRLMRGFSKT